MPRVKRHATDAPGHDSFLDIVANMVGILIILVMVVAVRVKNAPVLAISDRTGPLAAELEQDIQSEAALYREARDAEGLIREVEREATHQRQRRDTLALLVAAAEQEIAARRAALDAEDQEAFDLERKLAAAQVETEQVRRQRIQIENVRPEPIILENFPTPLSKAVNSHETHFQLKGGRILPIPLDELIEGLKQSVERQVYKFEDQQELTDTIGPLGGFRLRYTMAVVTDRGRRGAVLRDWTLIPVSGQMGEPAEKALTEGSAFRQFVGRLRPTETTITIWTYEDSFEAFRELKVALHRQGFSVAARPLPLGIPIGGSPKGSKSAAE